MSTYSSESRKGLPILRYIFFVLIGIGMITLFIGFFSCANKKQQEKRTMSIEEVIKKHTPELMSITGVVGTAQGKKNREDCILVLTAKKTPEMIKKIPSSLEGFPVVIQETGEIRPLKKL
jgi:hypothetical protein